MNSMGVQKRRDSSSSSLPSKSLPLHVDGRKVSAPRESIRLVVALLLSMGWYSLKLIVVSAVTSGLAKGILLVLSRPPPAMHGRNDTSAYNEQEALQHIYYAKVSFCTEHAITSWSCGDMCEKASIVGTDKVRFIPEGERFKVHGYVAQVPTSTPTSSSISRDHEADDVKCMIGFRGSVNWANWYANFHLSLRDWPLNDLSGADWCRGCKAHYGFTEIYEELRPNVHKAIEELNCTRLVLTGHSLGAAVATIASFELRAAQNYQVDATWTFGKPRIGNAEFVNSFEAAADKQGVSPPLWRVIHYHDPVPRAPPDFLGLHPVTHGSLEVYYTDRASSNYLICPQNGATENQSDACMGGWPLYFPVNMDHVSYLNETFAFKDFPDECKAEES